eukprot:2287983-Rhodomonas_salina.1
MRRHPPATRLVFTARVLPQPPSLTTLNTELSTLFPPPTPSTWTLCRRRQTLLSCAAPLSLLESLNPRIAPHVTEAKDGRRWRGEWGSDGGRGWLEGLQLRGARVCRACAERVQSVCRACAERAGAESASGGRRGVTRERREREAGG